MDAHWQCPGPVECSKVITTALPIHIILVYKPQKLSNATLRHQLESALQHIISNNSLHCGCIIITTTESGTYIDISFLNAIEFLVNEVNEKVHIDLCSSKHLHYSQTLIL